VAYTGTPVNKVNHSFFPPASPIRPALMLRILRRAPTPASCWGPTPASCWGALYIDALSII